MRPPGTVANGTPHPINGVLLRLSVRAMPNEPRSVSSEADFFPRGVLATRAFSDSESQARAVVLQEIDSNLSTS